MYQFTQEICFQCRIIGKGERRKDKEEMIKKKVKNNIVGYLIDE